MERLWIMLLEKCSGWKQAELTELGRERATKLGELKKDMDFEESMATWLGVCD